MSVAGSGLLSFGEIRNCHCGVKKEKAGAGISPSSRRYFASNGYSDEFYRISPVSLMPLNIQLNTFALNMPFFFCRLACRRRAKTVYDV